MALPSTSIQSFLQRLNIDDINSICKPLEENFGLTSLVYRKNYYDGTEISLSNQSAWVEHYYTNKALMQQSTFDKHPDTYQSGFIFSALLVIVQKLLTIISITLIC